VHETNQQDPYITVPDEDDESDEDDVDIGANDSVLLVGRTEEEHSSLEVPTFSLFKRKLIISPCPLTDWLIQTYCCWHILLLQLVTRSSGVEFLTYTSHFTGARFVGKRECGVCTP
jgi:hypothetical protein